MMDAAQIESQIKSAEDVWDLKKEYDQKGVPFTEWLDKAIERHVPASAHEKDVEGIIKLAVSFLRTALKRATRKPPTTRVGRWIRSLQDLLEI